MIHPGSAGVKRTEIRDMLSKKFKASEDRIAIFGLKAKYGGGRSTAFATIYDDMDSRHKYDTKTNLYRVSGGPQARQRMHFQPGLPRPGFTTARLISSR